MKRHYLALFGAIFLAACEDTAQITQPEVATSQPVSASAALVSGGATRWQRSTAPTRRAPM